MVEHQAFAQGKNLKIEQIKPIDVRAEVISVFEKSNTLALLKIVGVDSANTFRLEKGGEVLTKFYFTTKPTKGDPKLAGIRAGDQITAEISSTENPMTGQMDYQVFRYRVLPRCEKSAKSDSLKMGGK